MLGDGNNVRTCDLKIFQSMNSFTSLEMAFSYLKDLDALRNCGIEINVVRTDTGSDTDLEVFSPESQLRSYENRNTVNALTFATRSAVK